MATRPTRSAAAIARSTAVTVGSSRLSARLAAICQASRNTSAEASRVGSSQLMRGLLGVCLPSDRPERSRWHGTDRRRRDPGRRSLPTDANNCAAARRSGSPQLPRNAAAIPVAQPIQLAHRPRRPSVASDAATRHPTSPGSRAPDARRRRSHRSAQGSAPPSVARRYSRYRARRRPIPSAPTASSTARMRRAPAASAFAANGQ